jgi:hypothetical protein
MCGVSFVPASLSLAAGALGTPTVGKYYASGKSLGHATPDDCDLNHFAQDGLGGSQ